MGENKKIIEAVDGFKRLEGAEIGSDSRKPLIEGLYKKGIKHAEVLEALTAWTIEREKIVEALGRTLEACIGFEIDRANIYAEGGYRNEALDVLYEALYIAQQENKLELELEKEIRKEIAQMDGAE
ncbi:MAG: hypothetical protein UW32_C0003G0101 [Candidatus Wolfebacteria bacterium GW2011_GWE2_44_13]|uniref:Uncharacterized protein n=1 Tax=Candidatus Wolfebacteria bacterium GW2011_GWE2_44_13 TaxID=1619017 RepID=A0A0G1H916_9BACT|nr:MAG: hypothetical protein UW32_C0003G0101 [Candidatus Wolfebacteria bacterium GW2011_GWE2_44_13]